jgi:hypothetical protein
MVNSVTLNLRVIMEIIVGRGGPVLLMGLPVTVVGRHNILHISEVLYLVVVKVLVYEQKMCTCSDGESYS